MKKIEGFGEIKRKYLNGGRREKDEILRGLETIHGYHRKSAISLLKRVVNRTLENRRPKKQGAKPRYRDPEFLRALRKLWSDMEWQCARNMKSAIPRWLPDFEDENGKLKDDGRERLLQVSHSTIDRLLK